MRAGCRYHDPGPWVFDACGEGHCWHTDALDDTAPPEIGTEACYRSCCRCDHVEYTPAHRAQAAWLAGQERAEKAS